MPYREYAPGGASQPLHSQYMPPPPAQQPRGQPPAPPPPQQQPPPLAHPLHAPPGLGRARAPQPQTRGGGPHSSGGSSVSYPMPPQQHNSALGQRQHHSGGHPGAAVTTAGGGGPPQPQPHAGGSFTRVSAGGQGGLGSSLALQEAKRLNGELVRAPTVDHLFYLIDQRVSDFSHINSSTALHRLARLSKQEGLFTLEEMVMGPMGQARAWAFERLMASIESHLIEFNTQSLANILWGMASLSYHPGDLLDLMAVEALKRIRSFNPQELANTVWALAKLSRFARFTHQQQQLVDAIAVECRRKLDAYNPQNLVNTVWAYATLARHPGDAMLQAVVENSHAKIQDFNPQNISNLLWALATLHYYPGDALLEAVQEEAMWKLRDFNSQNLANTLWAFASLGHHPGRLADAIAAAAESKLHSFTSQGLSNLLWAFAALGHHPGTHIVECISVEAERQLYHFSSQELSNTCFALAKLHMTQAHPVSPSERLLMQAIAAEAERKIAKFKPRDLTDLLWAFATEENSGESDGARLSDNALEVAASTVERSPGQFSPGNLAVALWSLAALGHRPRGPGICEAAAAEARRRAGELKGTDLANLLLSFTAFEEPALGAQALSAIQRGADVSSLVAELPGTLICQVTAAAADLVEASVEGDAPTQLWEEMYAIDIDSLLQGLAEELIERFRAQLSRAQRGGTAARQQQPLEAPAEDDVPLSMAALASLGLGRMIRDRARDRARKKKAATTTELGAPAPAEATNDDGGAVKLATDALNVAADVLAASPADLPLHPRATVEALSAFAASGVPMRPRTAQTILQAATRAVPAMTAGDLAELIDGVVRMGVHGGNLKDTATQLIDAAGVGMCAAVQQGDELRPAAAATALRAIALSGRHLGPGLAIVAATAALYAHSELSEGKVLDACWGAAVLGAGKCPERRMLLAEVVVASCGRLCGREGQNASTAVRAAWAAACLAVRAADVGADTSADDSAPQARQLSDGVIDDLGSMWAALRGVDPMELANEELELLFELRMAMEALGIADAFPSGANTSLIAAAADAYAEAERERCKGLEATARAVAAALNSSTDASTTTCDVVVLAEPEADRLTIDAPPEATRLNGAHADAGEKHLERSDWLFEGLSEDPKGDAVALESLEPEKEQRRSAKQTAQQEAAKTVASAAKAPPAEAPPRDGVSERTNSVSGDDPAVALPAQDQQPPTEDSARKCAEQGGAPRCHPAPPHATYVGTRAPPLIAVALKDGTLAMAVEDDTLWALNADVAMGRAAMRHGLAAAALARGDWAGRRVVWVREGALKQQLAESSDGNALADFVERLADQGFGSTADELETGTGEGLEAATQQLRRLAGGGFIGPPASAVAAGGRELIAPGSSPLDVSGAQYPFGYGTTTDASQNRHSTPPSPTPSSKATGSPELSVGAAPFQPASRRSPPGAGFASSPGGWQQEPSPREGGAAGFSSSYQSEESYGLGMMSSAGIAQQRGAGAFLSSVPAPRYYDDDSTGAGSHVARVGGQGLPSASSAAEQLGVPAGLLASSPGASGYDLGAARGQYYGGGSGSGMMRAASTGGSSSFGGVGSVRPAMGGASSQMGRFANMRPSLSQAPRAAEHGAAVSSSEVEVAQLGSRFAGMSTRQQQYSFPEFRESSGSGGTISFTAPGEWTSSSGVTGPRAQQERPLQSRQRQQAQLRQQQSQHRGQYVPSQTTAPHSESGYERMQQAGLSAGRSQTLPPLGYRGGGDSLHQASARAQERDNRTLWAGGGNGSGRPYGTDWGSGGGGAEASGGGGGWASAGGRGGHRSSQPPPMTSFLPATLLSEPDVVGGRSEPAPAAASSSAAPTSAAPQLLFGGGLFSGSSSSGRSGGGSTTNPASFFPSQSSSSSSQQQQQQQSTYGQF